MLNTFTIVHHFFSNIYLRISMFSFIFKLVDTNICEKILYVDGVREKFDSFSDICKLIKYLIFFIILINYELYYVV